MARPSGAVIALFMAEHDTTRSTIEQASAVPAATAPGSTGAAAAIVHGMLARGAVTPERVASVLVQHPHGRDEVFTLLQTTFGNGFVQAVIGALATPRAAEPTGGLPAPVRAKMEAALGADFADVRVHASSPRADALGAQAFAQGNDLHFAAGAYDPTSPAGQALIGHELAHVVQQRQGRVAATIQAKGAAINSDPALEAEADQRGAAAAATADHQAIAQASPAPAASAPGGGVIQRVEKRQVDDLILGDQRDNREAESLAGFAALQNFVTSKIGADRAAPLFEQRGIQFWPVDFKKLLQTARRADVNALEGSVTSELQKGLVQFQSLETLVHEVNGGDVVDLLRQFGFTAVLEGLQQYREDRPDRSASEFLRQRALAQAPSIDVTGLRAADPGYKEVKHDRDVLDSAQRTAEMKPPMEPNAYINRHITPSTMTFLFENPDVHVFVLEGSVNDLLAFTVAQKYTALTRLEDNAKTDFIKYTAHDPSTGRACVMVLAPSGDAYRREVLAHFTHYRGGEHRIDPGRIHLMQLHPDQADHEFDDALRAIGAVDAVVFGKVDEFGTTLAERGIGPARVIRSVTPPLFGKIYQIQGKRVLSIQIEPGLYASRAGAFMKVLLRQNTGMMSLLFTGTSGAVDPQFQVNDLVAPTTFSSVNGLEQHLTPNIDNLATGVLDRMQKTSTDERTVAGEGRLPGVFTERVNHGAVESILLEDAGWLATHGPKAQAHDPLSIVEQEVASLIQASAEDLQRLRFAVFFTVSDVLGQDSFSEVEQHQTAEPRFKPGQILVSALETMLGLGALPEATRVPVSEGSLQSQIGGGTLGETAKQMTADLQKAEKVNGSNLKKINGIKDETEANEAKGRVDAEARRIAEQRRILERIHLLIQMRKELGTTLMPLLDQLRKLHPKHAKVMEGHFNDALIEASQKTSNPGKIKADMVTSIVQALQRYGLLASELLLPARDKVLTGLDGGAL